MNGADWHEEKQRLERRIFTIRGTDEGRALRRYRTQINKRSAILERGVAASVVHTGPRAYYTAADEVPLCHAFLDSRGVEACL